jgi:deoxyribodipyrimidine photo-lyase
LTMAARHGGPVLCLYIIETGPGVRERGGASRWWLNKSLDRLGKEIAARGGRLLLRVGEAETIICETAEQIQACAVFWNRRYGPEKSVDQRIKATLAARGVKAVSANGSALIEPFDLRTAQGHAYRVFTPFWRALRTRYTPPEQLDAPDFQPLSLRHVDGVSLADLHLHPSKPDWSEGLERTWTPGEAGAGLRLERFLSGGLRGYGEGRNQPGLEGTSRLSPHLAFGEISPAAIWRSAMAAGEAGAAPAGDIEKFLSEIGWREFARHLVFEDPEMVGVSWKRSFERVPWRTNADDETAAWRKGRTGYPIVDAGMRQLWRTGWMHNRVRMIVASFLVKHLLVHWREGERWFWDTLVDADIANNPAGWQWVAGCGADAAPYFRIFNPVLQGEKFDPDGAYIRAYCPELSGLSPRWIHKPWLAPAATLAQAGVRLGQSYPHPIVEHAPARARALAALGEGARTSSPEETIA